MKHFQNLVAAAAVLIASAGMGMADELQDIIDAGKIRVGIALTGEPIGFRDGQNNPVGYDVDVANHLAQTLGVELEIVEVNGQNRIPMLQSNQIDLIIANITATLERAKSIDFTIPYLRSGIKLLVRDGSDIKDMAGLDGKKVIVGRGTTGEEMIKRAAPGAEMVYVDVFAPDGLLLLRQERADAAIEDSSLIDYAAKQFPDSKRCRAYTRRIRSQFGVRKGEPNFLRWLDIFVSQYISSGAYAANYMKWWGVEPVDLVAPW